jgi:hypothetical protein
VRPTVCDPRHAGLAEKLATVWPLVFSVVVAVTTPASDGCKPAPRYLVDEVRRSVTAIMAWTSPAQPRLKTRHLVLTSWPTELGTSSSGALRFHLSGIGACPESDRPEVCRALGGSASPQIECDAVALAALAGDRSAGETEDSPALFFVLAHELGHIATGAAGTFVEDGVYIDSKSPRDIRSADMGLACGSASSDLESESRADSWARAALDAALDGDRFGAGALGSRGARTSAVGAIRAAADRFMERQRPKDVMVVWNMSSLRAIDLTDNDLRAGAMTAHCDITRITTGRILVPTPGNTHPSTLERLAKISKALAASNAARPPDATSPLSQDGNMADLLKVVEVTGAQLDDEDFRNWSRFVQLLCEDSKLAPPEERACRSAHREWTKVLQRASRSILPRTARRSEHSSGERRTP